MRSAGEVSRLVQHNTHDGGIHQLWFFRSPRLIVFGEGALDYLKELEGKRVFIATDKTMVKLGFLKLVEDKLTAAGKEVAHYDGVLPEPPDTVVHECLALLRNFKPDIVLGLGGGSAMDVAKVARILYEYPDMPIMDITPITTIKVKKTTLVAIPTTSGTGSDATWAAVITNTKEHFKMELTSTELLPFISIVDPIFTKSLPPEVTAAPGMDALAQAIEGFTVQWRNDFSDAMSIHSIKLILKYLPVAYSHPDDMEAREKLHNAATISGMSWSNSFLGVTHSFGHAMGALYKMPHGVAVGIVLPYSIEYSIKTSANLYGDLARQVGVATPQDDDKTASLKLRDVVRTLMRKMKIPLSLKEYGIPKKKFEETFDELCRMTEQSAVNIFSCREPTNEDIRQMWKCMYEGKSIDF